MPPPIKRKKVLNALKQVENEGGVYIYHGGRHLKVVAIKDGAGSFPIPVSHPEVNAFILKAFKVWMKENGIKGVEHIEKLLR